MDTCFLFTKHLTETGCCLVKLDANGQLLVAPAQQRFEDIIALQKDSKTIIVESCENTSMHSIALSWLPERKARLAIPYALEDQLAQPLNHLHFAFDKLRYQDNHYLVTVISKERLQFIMQLMIDQGIEYQLITSGWFALSPQEIVVSESTLLIHHTDYKGAFSGDLAQSYLQKHPLSPVLVFQDSLIPHDASKKEEHSFVWIAQQLLKTKPLNLCQGDMQHGNESEVIQKRFYQAGALCCIWLLSILVVKAISLYSLTKKTAQIDAEIAQIYHEFFPNAQQVISPKFRIQQLLNGNDSSNETHFWMLLNQFAKAMKSNDLTLEQLRYQNRSLNVTLVSADFAAIEQLKHEMKVAQLKVRQTQASTRDKRVVVTLELTGKII